MLLRSRANPNSTLDASGETPLLAIARRRFPWPPFAVEHALLAARADPERSEEMTPLMWAASRGNMAFCNLLIEARAEVSRQGPSGHRAVELAAAAGHDRVAASLAKLAGDRKLAADVHEKDLAEYNSDG
ncbi:unnamed protein product [Polarella glacialis]|uniref:Ankyrin repeat domain-containing protein n=1 Tax=Polarella glacialis TaxID=89957 RepID=A0A813FZU9_POLGL|nr:unnamed protein product [Polarella glacialis]